MPGRINPKPSEIATFRRRRAGSADAVALRRDTCRVHKSVKAARRSPTQECVRHGKALELPYDQT